MPDADWKATSLSFRQESKGGEVKQLDQAERQVLFENLRRELSAKPLPVLLLLVHGYNNNEEEATKAYENGFRDCQRRIAQERGNQPILDNRVVGEVFWPGDANWGLFSFLFYMGSIEHALQSSKELANVLVLLCREIPQLKIEIVAHSMGCRLTLELLRQMFWLYDRINCVVLMAAAVPTFKLENSNRGTLRSVIENVPVKSLYSNSDIVLSTAFPLGQTFAPGDEGILPVALGHNSWVDGNAYIEQKPVDNAGHSDYWGWNPKTMHIGMEANKLVRSMLGQYESCPRTIGDRVTLVRRNCEDISGAESFRNPTRIIGDKLIIQ